LSCFPQRYIILGEGFCLLGETLNVEASLIHCVTNHFSVFELLDNKETHATIRMFSLRETGLLKTTW